MFDCENCKNSMICKQREDSKKILDELEVIKQKYKNFFGRIVVRCDYFVPDKVERNTFV